MSPDYPATRTLLLLRHGALYVDPGSELLPDAFLQLVEVNLAKIGYALTSELRARLRTVAADDLMQIQARTGKALLARTGGNLQFQPQFRRFPADVPANTFDLWRQRVLSHFMQGADQPCLHCARTGTTHVLNPCCHVVCDVCFDGANYSACPICGQQANQDSAFFKPSAVLPLPSENIKFKLLHLGASLVTDARTLFVSLCARTQAMSPVDKDAFITIIGEFGLQTLAWLPALIPVRENIAWLFGTLLRTHDPALVLQAAAPYLSTCTDVLRLVAAYSGADPALQGRQCYRRAEIKEVGHFARFRRILAAWPAGTVIKTLQVSQTVYRFKVARINRPLRRALLAFMESLDPDSLTEDMLRHRSYWVWMGQFLHPGEYAKRYPHTAAAFQVIRKRAYDAVPAPAFSTYYARLESAAQGRDIAGLARLLSQRPGELARRIDHALRVAGDDTEGVNQLLQAFEHSAPRFATPVLLTLRALMPTRTAPLPARIFWPKGATSQAVFEQDRRAPLSPAVAAQLAQAAEAELLRRFARLPRYADVLVDAALRQIMAPFNERTASRSAIQLPRGSTLAITPGEQVRLFLHWCEPQTGGGRTDLDLSVAFYSESWQYLGVCSYYELSLAIGGDTIATSAGDLTSAPYPQGASEFIDIDRALAAKHGIRYAVAVVNNYSGAAFGDLEHAFAGLMLRDDLQGSHFDPRSVEMKFDLQGGEGIFMPMVFDMQKDRIHWLDVYSRGSLEFNNVASSNNAITAICPAMLGYFGSGVRTSMYELALLHAAARGDRLIIRDQAGTRVIEKAAAESASDFLGRTQHPDTERRAATAWQASAPVLALLLDGDLALPAGSQAFILKPGAVTGNLAASDLIG